MELKSDNCLHFSIRKSGIFYGQFKLDYSTRCADSSLRDFCFKLYKHTTGETVYFAAESMSSKESWTEAIHTALSRIRLLVRKTTSPYKSGNLNNRMAQVMNQYISRPLIYVKVIRARNLTSKKQSMNPFVKVLTS